MYAAVDVERFSDPPNDIGHWRVPRCVRAVNPPSPRPPLPRGSTQSAMTLQVWCSFFQFIVVAACPPACLPGTLCSVNKRVLRPVPKPRSIGVALQASQMGGERRAGRKAGG